MQFHGPRALLESTEAAFDGLPPAQLFNNPKYQKLRETWCAAMFGLGYSKNVVLCEVAVNDSRERQDIDLYLRAGSDTWGFQLAEVLSPERRRGAEYKNNDVRLYHVPAEVCEPKFVAQLLAAAVERKKSQALCGQRFAALTSVLQCHDTRIAIRRRPGIAG
jgi:hypothetical protein